VVCEYGAFPFTLLVSRSWHERASRLLQQYDGASFVGHVHDRVLLLGSPRHRIVRQVVPEELRGLLRCLGESHSTLYLDAGGLEIDGAWVEALAGHAGARYVMGVSVEQCRVVLETLGLRVPNMFR